MPVAGVTEWTKVADSRSAPVGVRGFESCPPHMIIGICIAGGKKPRDSTRLTQDVGVNSHSFTRSSLYYKSL